nr:uncharacterized protein LOC126056305 [Helicoverpa armigera]
MTRTPSKESRSSSEELIKDLNKRRGVVRGKFRLFMKYVDSVEVMTTTETIKSELQTRLQKVDLLLEQFTEIQDEIDLKIPDSQVEKELSERESFETNYYAYVTKAKCIINADDVQNSSKIFSKVKLPTISLPSFDGSYDHWLEYRDTYLSLVHNSKEIDNVQKFHYLRSSLSGSALLVIKSLEFSSENYNVAWELLENRFNNNRLLVQTHVKALFSMTSLNKESPNQIRKLIDTVLKNLRSLKNLGEPTESWDTLIIYLITSKLDSVTEREWETHKSSIINSQNQSISRTRVDDLITFLKNRADVLETINFAHSKSYTDNNIKKPSQSQQSNKSHSYTSTQNKQPNNKNSKRPRICAMCQANHPLYSCESFLKLNINDRIKFVNEKKLCCNCLRANHSADECWFGPCKQCNKKHNNLLHDKCDDSASVSTSPVVAHNSQASSQNTTSGKSLHTATLHSASHTTHQSTTHSLLETVLLSTALVEVADKSNNYHTTRALLDNGSQHSFIAESLCKRLKLNLIQSTVQVSGVGNSVTNSTQSCEINLRSKTTQYNTRMKCLVLNQITAQLPCLGTTSNINIPDHVQLADSEFYSPSEIELLIGADKFWELLTDGLIRLSSGPYLQNTQLGWVISGPLLNKKTSRNNRVQCNYSQSLDAQLRKFWELEELPPQNKLTNDESLCENLFLQTTYRDNTGRFFVRIPLAEPSDTLGDTYALALNRFHALERKLDKSTPEYKRLYCDFMNEYLSLGHMSRVNSYPSPNYFLPHHGVLRIHSSTTKLRVVFDGSAKSTSGKSLNDIQHIGPSLHNDVFSILLRFRQFRFVACADVEKMFRQINLQPDQRNLQLIIWRENKSDELGVFQLNTVTYGTASAPYLSIRCIKQLASECKDDVIKQVINEDLFVDDLITGNDDKQCLLDICTKVNDTLKSGCFHLRKWLFNSESSTTDQQKDLSLGENCLTKTLGIGWLNYLDLLYFTTKIDQNFTHVTKRVILSVVSQVYDPLGLLSPAIIIVKILLQKLWLCKLSWDDPVPNDILSTWKSFIATLQHLQDIKIPRHVREINTNYTDLHIFSDASQDAYGACAFISTYNDNSPATVRILCAKTKVAPIKPVTIPRLELCGALVGAKLYQKIVQSWRLKFNHIYFWSDSMIVINWIKMSPNLLKTFVQNRVVQINELTGELPWLHVAGKDNPADLLSRGLTLDALQSTDIWWHGPAFLKDMHMNFKYDNQNEIINLNDLPEMKSKVLFTQSTYTSIFIFERFSNFNRMRRAAAYVLRFINNARIKSKTERSSGPLTADELNKSTLVLVRLAQHASFADILNQLINNLPVKSMRNISSLDVFLDSDRIIRVGGRLVNSRTFPYSKKHPILLCSKHTFTRLLFQFEHKRLLHAGPQLLLATIRESWWPLRGRDLAKQTVHKCIICTRQKGKALSVKMGNLPFERLEPGYPFLRCGVDYAGPMFILNRKGRGSKLEKCYVCLFICFTTRAIHLELVTSLTSEAYLLALKRFLCRRGKPAYIFSDNGKTFVGALKEFSDFLNHSENDILNFAANENIKFSFIPPYSPHFGGLWEAGVKSFKYHLRRVGNVNLTYEEFSTLLAQIEALLNSRPMYPMSSDPNDLLPLTPAHFLIGRPLTAPACEDLTASNTSRLVRYERIEQMRQNFWKRWSQEYVSELQTRTKWQYNTGTIAPNTLVLIKDDNLPPLKWRLGRVITTFPGKDGLARVADIKTANGVIRRSYPRLCPLLQEEEP